MVSSTLRVLARLAVQNRRAEKSLEAEAREKNIWKKIFKCFLDRAKSSQIILQTFANGLPALQ